MINTIYIEEQVADHPRVRQLLDRHADAAHVYCDSYGEIFNPAAQNFRLQKNNPALILAKKHDGFVLPAPVGYGIGGSQNYYFSHMLNCIYDCRYCFLQGMYRSAHYLLFVNYEDFATAIEKVLHKNETAANWFFSGYDCDSLALESVTGFVEYFMPFFRQHPAAHVELRTKSIHVRPLLKMQSFDNAVIAFSFTPEETSRALEHKVPSVTKRLDAMARLQKAGWHIGLRFDPLIYGQDFKQQYRRLFEQSFAAIDPQRLHSVSLGPFRLPRSYFKNIVHLYPDEQLFAGPLQDHNGMVSYRKDLETELTQFCTQQLLSYVSKDRLFPCVYQ